MISYLRLQRFKCFMDQFISLEPLTILAGSNNTGKSSVIQALLLLRQTAKTGRLKKGEILLNGPLVHLGTGQDVFCQWAEEDNINMSVNFTEAPEEILKWNIQYTTANSEDLNLKILEGTEEKLIKGSLFNNNFSYIGANRIGPQLAHSFSEETIEELNVGVRGEFTVHCLQQFQMDKIKLKELKYSSEDQSETLSFQTEKWINYLIPGIRFKYSRLINADILSISVSNNKPDRDTDYLRPTNVGFGISYCLPVVVAGLMSRKDSLLIVENPEAHLHPGAQSRMGHFFSRLASAGVQVIVETHSDHILNGIRVSVKNKIINPENISINYFDENYNLHNPEIDSDGRIDCWPEGFFDQTEKDLQELI